MMFLFLVVLLMVQKSGVYQLRLVVYPVIYRVLYFPGGYIAGFFFVNSMFWLLIFHFLNSNY